MNHIFISYSHQDRLVLEDLLPFLTTLQSENLADVWSDDTLRAGDRWRREIDAAIDRATIAILLISQNFLASAFVRAHELPQLLARQEAGRLTVLPIFVSPSTVEASSISVCMPGNTERRMVLSEFQGFGTPNLTLSEMRRSARERRFVELHQRIRELSATSVIEPPAPQVPGDIAIVPDDVRPQIERISDFHRSERLIEEALALYARCIPGDEQYAYDDMVGIVRRHLTDEYGSDWKMHFLVATLRGTVVGFLIAYDDLRSNLTFVSYLGNDKPPADNAYQRIGRRASVDAIGCQLAGALLDATMKLRPDGTPSRFLFEIDSPDLATTATERRRRAGRLKLFEQFSRLAAWKGLRVRAIDVEYRQPPLGWPPSAGSGRPLILCYAAPSLGSSLSQSEVAKLLDWVYLSLYDSDLLEMLEDRAPYKEHVMALLVHAKNELPERVPLLRSPQRSAKSSAAPPPQP